MATYPYIPVQGAIRSLFGQLQQYFPPLVDAAYLQKSDIAPANEASALSVVRFLGFTDENNKKVKTAAALLNKPEAEFQAGLLEILKDKYAELMEINPTPWALDKANLVHFFRAADDTSAHTGSRQASTFLTLAELAGCDVAEAAKKGSVGASPKRKPKVKTEKKAKSPVQKTPTEKNPQVPVQLAVRIEMNLPVTDDQSVYDALFKSMRENLIDLAD